VISSGPDAPKLPEAAAPAPAAKPAEKGAKAPVAKAAATKTK
jgi:hypothetical protein